MGCSLNILAKNGTSRPWPLLFRPLFIVPQEEVRSVKGGQAGGPERISPELEGSQLPRAKVAQAVC